MHPDYQGGYYNPQSGFYDAPSEVSFQIGGPGPGMTGPGSGAPVPELGGLNPGDLGLGSPVGPYAQAASQPDSASGWQQGDGPQVAPYDAAASQPGSDAQGAPPSQGQQQDQPTDQGTDHFDMGSFIEALAAMGSSDFLTGGGY